jgi:hypothetical protein
MEVAIDVVASCIHLSEQCTRDQKNFKK